MSYILQAIVGTCEVLGHPHHQEFEHVRLRHGLLMIPLSSELRRHHGIPDLPLTNDDDDTPAIPGSLDALCRRLSQHGLVAYLEAELFGGEGMQAHALFRSGAALGSPIVARNAINQALRKLGVLAGDHHDEFAAVDLGRYRDTDKWIDKGS